MSALTLAQICDSGYKTEYFYDVLLADSLTIRFLFAKIKSGKRLKDGLIMEVYYYQRVNDQ